MMIITIYNKNVNDNIKNKNKCTLDLILYFYLLFDYPKLKSNYCSYIFIQISRNANKSFVCSLRCE